MYDAVTREQAPMSIDQPVRNTDYLILDREGRPSTGTGELGTTGTNLALGYLELPELTRQRFVAIGADRVYRTGDIVEQDSDGNSSSCIVRTGRFRSVVIGWSPDMSRPS
jgi:non-ribosomal peptide synthetase component F